MQPTGVDILVAYNRDKLYNFIYIKTMEMIIDSEGREIKLLTGYLKGTVCIACRSYYKEVFLI